MNIKKQIDRLCRKDSGYWAQRLHSQLDYLNEALQEQEEYSEDTLLAVLAELAEIKQEKGALTKQDVLLAEKKLESYVPLAKRYQLRMVSHAHIDMNWQWGYEETVGVVIDTFRTMLRLLQEYPSFIFTQSQASVYEIVEKYAPDMLPEIRQRIQEGRWEVIASTWVEADKNMINAESMSRHILYTRQYLKELLGLKDEEFTIDFEPDTFGHSAFVPEILSQGGIKYYYHCRGYEDHEVYRWKAPSGAEVLALRDPQWYLLLEMDYHMAYHVPGFCRKNHTDTAIRFYGVGDHGGGPTRQDMERILDMQTWPLMPRICFSTLHDAFRELEKVRGTLPVVQQELNCVFTGCYTSQARIKQANRQGEDRLYDSEALCAMARAMGCDLTGMPSFADAWKKELFSQFHDILPGSGIRETREYALGQAQEINARCLANANRALHAMGEKIATERFSATADPDSRAESAGAGYDTGRNSLQILPVGAPRFQVGSAGKSSGLVRPYTIFNPTQYDREELVELTVWDWPEALEATKVCDSRGNECDFDVLLTGKKYWQHTFSRIVFVAKVPAFGYANYYVMEADKPENRTPYPGSGRVHRISDAPAVLENAYVRATLNRQSMEVISLWDKETERELLSAPVHFSLVDEQDDPKYPAWIINPIGRRENLNQSCFTKVLEEKTEGVYQRITYELQFRNSKLTVCVSLAPTDRAIRFSLVADWNEFAVPGESTPQLQLRVPFGYESERVRYDVPGGSLLRPQLGHDVPAILYAAPVPNETQPGLVLTSDCKYGYRTFENVLSMTLFHSGHKPDRRPDTGIHHMELGLGIVPDSQEDTLETYAVCFAHPMHCYANTCHSGSWPEEGRLLKVTGSARVTGLKLAEKNQNLVLRLTRTGDAEEPIQIHCLAAVQGQMANLLENEQKVIPKAGGCFVPEIPEYGTRTVVFEMRGKQL